MTRMLMFASVALLGVVFVPRSPPRDRLVREKRKKDPDINPVWIESQLHGETVH